VSRILLIFVDGIGLAAAGPENPLATVPMPALAGLLGGSLTVERLQVREDLVLGGLDACLGVDGLPQSATGQTALFTGVNAPLHLGRHVAAFPGPRLAALLAEHSLLKRVEEDGRRAVFANPFTPAYFEAVARRERRHSATTLAALAAREPLRDATDLGAGRAVAWDVRRDHFRARAGADVEEVEPAEAGRHLAGLAGEFDFILYETFMTDLAGHGRWGWTAEEALTRLDGLLSGVVAARPADLTVLLTSDHGNLEESAHHRHTRNPVPLLAWGPAAHAFSGATALTDVAPAIRAALARGGVSSAPRDRPGS